MSRIHLDQESHSFGNTWEESMRGMSETPLLEGTKPEWDALPTVWAVSKPKETFWLWPMRSVYSVKTGVTPLTWGLSAVTQMQSSSHYLITCPLTKQVAADAHRSISNLLLHLLLSPWSQLSLDTRLAILVGSTLLTLPDNRCIYFTRSSLEEK